MTAIRRGRGAAAACRRCASSTTASSASRAGERRGSRRIEVDGAAHVSASTRSAPRRAPAGTGDQSGSSRPSSRLLPQHPAQRAVDERLVDGARRRRRDAAARRTSSRSGSSTSMPASSACARPPRPSPRDAVQQLEERDREVVGDDGAVEAPRRRAAAPVSSVAVGGRRHAVDVGVRVHHDAHAALADRHLERRQQHVGELARPDRDRARGCARPARPSSRRSA